MAMAWAPGLTLPALLAMSRPSPLSIADGRRDGTRLAPMPPEDKASPATSGGPSGQGGQGGPDNGGESDGGQGAGETGTTSGDSSPSDRQLLDRSIVCDVLARRQGAVTAAWHHFVPFVERVLRRLAGRHGETDDLTQEVFQRFFSKVDTLRSPDAVRAFLYGIALRVARKAARYRWLRRNLQSPVDYEQAAGTAPDPEGRQAARRLLEHLQALTAEQRSLIVARYVEGMDLRAVAFAHGLSFNTMRRRMDRAWERLERRLAKDDLLARYVGHRRPEEES